MNYKSYMIGIKQAIYFILMIEQEATLTLAPANQQPQQKQQLLTVVTVNEPEPLQQPSQQELQDALLNFAIKILPPPPKDVLQKLNPESPSDKALALCLKMVKQRQEKQAQQRKILAELRHSRINQPFSSLSGEVSRVIDQQHSIQRNQYLRQQHYLTIPVRPKRLNQSVVLPKISLSQRKNIIRHQAEQLQKYKLINLRYETKKIVTDILYQVISRTVELYHRKIGFWKKDNKKKISDLLALSLVRKKGRKGSLTLSRVIDIAISNDEEKESQGQSDRSGSEPSSGDEQGSESSVENDSQSLVNKSPSSRHQDTNSQEEISSASQSDKGS